MNSSKSKDRIGVVYSTDENFKFETAKKKEPNLFPPEKQQLKVSLDTKSRAGKTTTVIAGFIGKSTDFELLSKKIKSKCGAGGTTKDKLIIIQGDFRTKILAMLVQEGFQAKII